jgi:hypothetical protein
MSGWAGGDGRLGLIMVLCRGWLVAVAAGAVVLGCVAGAGAQAGGGAGVAGGGAGVAGGGAGAAIPTATLPVLTPAQMSAADAALLNAREAEVSRAAAFYGFDLSRADWKYEQVVCRALPEHLILGFTNANSPKGASHFTAVIPRGGGRVQVVAGYAHGLRPFKPSWMNPGSVAVFNGMVAEERGAGPIGGSDHWLNLGMCYAALTGPPPEAAIETQDVRASGALGRRNGATPIIRVGDHGAAEVAFSDVREAERTYNWTLSFDKSGRLKGADRAEAEPVKVKQQAIVNPGQIVAQ